MSIYTRCAMPIYRPLRAKPVPDDGYPHNPSHTLEIIESTRGDIRQQKVLLCATSSLIYGERLEYTPTNTAPKRMPDRAIRDKSRTIPDIRRVNLGIDAADCFPIWLADVNDITETALRTQRQFPGASAKICKCDISNALKRAPLRPDYCSIFPHQFDADNSKTSGAITLATLALPFGFSGSPAIFAICTEVARRAHHIAESENGSLAGLGPFRSEIFAGDSIFAEADIENIPAEVVECWGWCRRWLFGPDSINESKTESEGQWATRG